MPRDSLDRVKLDIASEKKRYAKLYEDYSNPKIRSSYSPELAILGHSGEMAMGLLERVIALMVAQEDSTVNNILVGHDSKTPSVDGWDVASVASEITNRGLTVSEWLAKEWQDEGF